MNTYEIAITLDDDQDMVLKGITKRNIDKEIKGSVQKYLQKTYEPIIMDLIYELMEGVLEELSHKEKPSKILGRLRRLEDLELEKEGVAHEYRVY